MPAAPGFQDFTITDKRFLKTSQLYVPGKSALFLAGETSAETPDHRHPPGTVLAYYTAGGGYVLATSANADGLEAASVDALVTNPGSGGWDGTVTLTGHWGSVTVTLSGDDTNAAVVTAINAALAALDPEWGPAVAAVTGSGATERVRVTNRESGKGTWLKIIHDDVTTAYGASGTTDHGTSPDILVTSHWAELKDVNGTAQDFNVATVYAGDFDTSELYALTGVARAVLEGRNSRFD